MNNRLLAEEIFGRAAQFTRNVALAPELKDGDGDGLIFDGTPQERLASEFARRLRGLRRRRGEDSRGVSLAVTETTQFQDWFRESKVVDDNGNPRVVYHGTTKPFTRFDSSQDSGQNEVGKGFYFAEHPDMANGYSRASMHRTANVMPVFLSIQNPLDLDERVTSQQAKQIADYYASGAADQSIEEGVRNVYRALDQQQPSDDEINNRTSRMRRNLLREVANAGEDGVPWGVLQKTILRYDRQFNQYLKQAGYDGIVHRSEDPYGTLATTSAPTSHGRVWIVFDANQIKSAIGNNGMFSLQSADIAKAVGNSAVFTRNVAQWKDGNVLKEDLP